MRISAHWYVPLLVLVASCGGGSGEAPKPADAAVTVVEKPLPPVSDVLALVYDNNYQVPSDFFVDARASTARSYTMHHVLDESGSFEMCTNDFATAQAWESADNSSRAVQGRFVGTVETDRYFEIARELSYTASIGNISDITSPGFARVFKCSDTLRDGVDRSVHSGFAGRINSRPLNPDRVREFTEYFWQFAFFPTARKKVLDTYSEQTSSSLSHTLLLGFASTGAGRNGCDRVEVVEWAFTTNRATGDTQNSFDVVAAYDAKLVGGSPTLCD